MTSDNETPPSPESDPSQGFTLQPGTWLDRIRGNPEKVAENLRCIVIQGMKADRWQENESYEVMLDRRDAEVMIVACNLLTSLEAKCRELSQWRNPEIWTALEEDASMENLTLALRHGRAMEARVVVLEKALMEQNKATGLIPSVLSALRSKQTGEKDE